MAEGGVHVLGWLISIIIYLINHVSAEALTIGWMIPLWTNTPPAEVIVIKLEISNIVRTTRFYNNLHQVRPKSKYFKDK